MLPLALSILVLSPQLAKGPLPPTPQSNVVIQDTRFILPPLPSSSSNALSDYKAVQQQIDQGLKDLEAYLSSLYATPGYLDTLPTSLKLPPDQAQEARTLIHIHQAPEFNALQKTMLAMWNAWARHLVEQGLVTYSTKEGQAVATDKETFMEEERERKKIAQNRKTWKDDKHDPITAFHDYENVVFSFAGGAEPSQYNEQWKQDRETFDVNVEKVRKKVKVTDVALPKMSDAWDPIVAHLISCAETLSTFEKNHPVPQYPGLVDLRLTTKVRYLERLRGSLWFCNVVWAQMASKPLPAPLRDLKGAIQPSQASLAHSPAAAGDALGGPGAGAPRTPEPVVPSPSLPARDSLPARAPASLEPLRPLVGRSRAWPGLETCCRTFLTPNSDPRLLEAVRNLHRDSPSFREQLEAFYRAFPDVMLHLQITSDRSSGNITLHRTENAYLLVLGVQGIPARQKKDHLEPWLASLVFKAREMARRGEVKEIAESSYLFSKELEDTTWAFQHRVREDLRLTGKYPLLNLQPELLYVYEVQGKTRRKAS